MSKHLQFIFLLFPLVFSINVSAEQKDSLTSDNAKVAIPDVSHFLFNNIISNPAYTGLFNGQNIMAGAEFTCPMLESNLVSPQQYIVTYDGTLDKKGNNAIGVYLLDDLSGAFVNSSIGINYAHNFNFTPKSSFYNNLNIGVSLSYNQISLDWDNLTWGDQIDPRDGFVFQTGEKEPASLTYGYYNLILGLWYSNPYLYFGASISNLTSPSFSFLSSIASLPLTFNIGCGGYIVINKHLSLSPSVNAELIKGYKGLLNSYSPAFTFTYGHNYIAGLSYMDLNKITVNVGCVLFDRLRISAACGFFTNSDLYQFGTLGYAGGEIRYNIKSSNRKK